jgi:FkbM family methyltransferase
MVKMALLKTAGKFLPPPLRRRCRDFLREELAGWDPSAYVTTREAKLEVTLDAVLSDYRCTHPNPYFLQVGAFDGVSTDPLYPLIEKHALKGILIEPQRHFFEKLRSNYARFEENRFVFVNAAIAEKDGTLPFYKIASWAHGPEWLHGIASLDRDVLMHHSSAISDLESLVEIENVRSLTFTSLFAEFGIRHVDLLQVDAEGYDALILCLFDIPTRKPAIVRFEHKHLTPQDHKSCLNALIDEGYKVALSDSGDTLAYHAQR